MKFMYHDNHNHNHIHSHSHTQIRNMFRIGSIVMMHGTEETKVGKIMHKSEKTQTGSANTTAIIYVIKLHYNGTLYLAQEKDICKATKEEKRSDKKNEVYWRNQYAILPLERNRFVDMPEML